jgi:hypothetical protein
LYNHLEGGDEMTDDKLERILPLLFRWTKVPVEAKATLQERLLGRVALSDDDLSLVTAAGEAAEPEQGKGGKKANQAIYPVE